MIKTVKQPGFYISDKNISLGANHLLPKLSCGLSLDHCGIQDEESEKFSKLIEEKPQRPPLKRGISRIKSDPKILPVTNTFLKIIIKFFIVII